MPIILSEKKRKIFNLYLYKIYEKIKSNEIEYKGGENPFNQGEWEFEVLDQCKNLLLIFKKNRDKDRYNLFTHNSLEIIIVDSNKKPRRSLPPQIDTKLFVLDENTYFILSKIIDKMIGEKSKFIRDIMDNFDIIFNI